MIIDTFVFSEELDLLEVRLNELDSVVDYFVMLFWTIMRTAAMGAGRWSITSGGLSARAYRILLTKVSKFVVEISL